MLLPLCRTQNRVIAEYSLRDLRKPMGIATFTVADALPAKVRAGLPTIEARLREWPDGAVIGV